LGNFRSLTFEPEAAAARCRLIGHANFQAVNRDNRMRPGQNKRMRGRNRRGPNPLTRSYESNGPDVKVRGTAQHIAEKYTQLARDAHLSGDPVAAESYLQHAEHYYRLIAAAVQAQQAAMSGTLDDRDDEDDDFDPASDRYTFRSPQAIQQQNQNGQGFYGQPGAERGPGEGGAAEAGGEMAEGETVGLPRGEGQPFQRHRDRDRDDRRNNGRDRDRFRGGERFNQAPRRPQPDVDGTGDQPDLPAFLTMPARAGAPEPEGENPVEGNEGEDGLRSPFRNRRRRRGRPGRPGEPGFQPAEGESEG
jgi:hypothetical protein